MKKYIPILVVLVLVISILGIAKTNAVLASPKPIAGANSRLLTLKTITETGLSNIGGVCTVDVKFKTTGNKVITDAEVPIAESKVVPPINPDGNNLLFPGCHIVFYKDNKIVNPVNTNDVTLKICFGASSELQMGIYYYLDTPASGNRVWVPLPTTLEDQNRLICAQAIYTGVYMPTGKLIPQLGTEQTETTNSSQEGGTVQPPPAKITVTTSGPYAVGGICLLSAEYFVSGLSDTVQVEFPTNHYTEDTLTVPFNDYIDSNLFYFPGCHVIHYRDEMVNNVWTRVIQDEMNMTTPKDGVWRICFAAIPDKTMTIYYYADNLTNITAPWKALETTTKNGMTCTDLADFSGVYAPVGK